MHSSGELAGISLMRRSASNILSNLMLSDVMTFGCNRKEIFMPFLVIERRYLLVPFARKDSKSLVFYVINLTFYRKSTQFGVDIVSLPFL